MSQSLQRVLHKEIPFLRIIIPLCAGIIAGLYFRPGTLTILAYSIITAAIFLAGLKFNKSLSNPVFGFAFSLSLFLFGIILYTIEKDSLSALPPEKALFTGVIDDYPEEKGKYTRLLLKASTVTKGDRKEKINGSILISLRRTTQALPLLPGDGIEIRLTPATIRDRGNPYEFSYRFYMENKGIKYFAFADSSDIFSYSVPVHRKAIYRALIIREKLIDMFRQRGVGGERLALVSAITLGQKNMLDVEQKSWFMKAGIMHIMAVSGLHAVILSLFIFRLLFFMKGRLNILRVIVTLIILWLFAFVTGLTPSVLRATLMFSFLQAGNLLKRPVNGVNSVLASAFVLILGRPSVIFDAGFLLSYSAVLYIIIFYKELYSKLRFRRKIPEWIWQTAAVTIIAQTGTLPLTVTLFNRFPLWFIISNVVIVPVSSLVIITGALVLLTYPLAFLSGLMARILEFLTWLTETLTEKAASLPAASIENIGMTTIECIVLSLFIFLLTKYLLNRKSIHVIYPVTAALLLAITTTVRVLMTEATSELIIYSNANHFSAGLRNGKNLYVYSDTCELLPEVRRHCSVISLRPEIKLSDLRSALIISGKRRILITDGLNQQLMDTACPDILVLTGSHPLKGRIDRISSGKLTALVISPASSPYFRIPGGSALIKADTIHYVRRDGAFRLRL